MEERLQIAERAFRENPLDVDAARDLARQALRAGRLGLALTATRAVPDDDELRAGVAGELADRLDLVFSSVVSSCERFSSPTGVELALVPGGAFLEEGSSAWTSSLELSGSRAPLKRKVVSSMLFGVRPERAADRRAFRERARGVGGRLPTPAEWKKAWRGGLFLDGDASSLHPNEEPDRLSPVGSALEPPEGEPLVSPYGIEFDPQLCEWCSEPGLGLILDTTNGRYHVDLGPQQSGRRFAGRVVIELPRL